MDSSENQLDEVSLDDRNTAEEGVEGAQDAQPTTSPEHNEPYEVSIPAQSPDDMEGDTEAHLNEPSPGGLEGAEPAVPETSVTELVEEAKPGEEEETGGLEVIPEEKYYNYEELCSRPFISEESNIPANLLNFVHSFGYDCGRRANLQLLDEQTLAYIAGNLLILLDVTSKEQRYLRSCSGGGIGAIMVHPSKRYLAVAEKGIEPNIIIYEYPSLRPYRILRGGTRHAYSSVDFNREGTLLASVGSAPDYMLTIWAWREEWVVLRSKAFSQDVYRVTFSPDNPGQLTTSGAGHIKFWKMTSTFTGLKLQGLLGRFGKTALTDIEGYVELPDGKVVSGSEWGNMLLWEGGLIKVEICRKGGRQCHSGAIQQFSLDEGELITIGTDGAVRMWDFETIDSADCMDDTGLFEMEPMNEMVVGRNVCLSCMVKSSVPDAVIWFAQDSNRGIWKLDLSFSNITHDPRCLFAFHAGPIQGMDVCTTSHLMATTALDCSVRIYDFLAKKELTTSRYNQGGTTLTWAPSMLLPSGSLLVVGFEDGVVRLLELYNPQNLPAVAGQSLVGNAQIRLKQAFKPHTAPVSAIAFQRNGEFLATGSTDCTVFFFIVGDRYIPSGFFRVPGPVQNMEWSPSSHEGNTLLVLCQNGHVVEIQSPEPETQSSSSTYELCGIRCRHFRFLSIKSRIKVPLFFGIDSVCVFRDAEVARRAAEKERRKKEREERLQRAKEQGHELTEEELQEGDKEVEEPELPPLHIPDPPSPVLCGFYSQPGAFWLSMGGYDTGFLYHCRFSDQQETDPQRRRDEPFAFLALPDTEDDPICSFAFSSDRQLLLCGMQSGHIRLYPLNPGDLHLTSMQSFWALSIHDNDYGLVHRVRFSHDGQFVLTAGQDGNIFAFSLLPPEDLAIALAYRQAEVPAPRKGIETEKAAQDIEDPNAYSIETAKQRMELDRLQREAEQRKAERRTKLIDLRNQFRKLLQRNEELPEHVRLQPAELELDKRFREETERLTAQRVREARKELAWEEERHRIGLQKLQERFRDSLESDTVTVVALWSEHKVSTYRLLALSQKFHQLKQQGQKGATVVQERWRSKATTSKDTTSVIAPTEPLPQDTVLQPRVQPPVVSKLASRQAEKLRKAAEKAEQARAKIQKRKDEWAALLASKPCENCEDPQDVLAIQQAMENMGDFKLKTAEDFTVPEHLRMNAERKRAQLLALEEQIHQRKTEMNRRIMALRDSKVQLVSWLNEQVQKLQVVQASLAPDVRAPVPTVPSLLPEEVPERKLQYTKTMLLQLQALRDSRGQRQELLELMDQAVRDNEDHDTVSPLKYSPPPKLEDHDPTELEKEMRSAEEITLLYMQDNLLNKMEQAVQYFDADLKLLRHDKLEMDIHMKLADLQHITLFQELLLLKEFEKRENSLQERLNSRMEEDHLVKSKLEECKLQLEMKRRDISKLQDQEKAIMATFLASLGENNKFADFLTKVFKKKIKRGKKKEKAGDEEEQEDSDEESEEESDWDEDEDGEGSESSYPLDDSVCPPNCDPELFEITLQLRERRLDLEELLADEKKVAESLRKDLESMTKKEKIVQNNLKAAEGDLELFNREKQRKLNELDVVVPLRLHQIEYVNKGAVPEKLDQALVLNRASLASLHERIRQLQGEKSQQRELYRQARQQHVHLIRDCKDMEASIQQLETRCEQLMMMKFGKLVDLEALQTLSGNRNLEEMRHEARVREATYNQELRVWEDKVREAKLAVTEVTKQHTERLTRMGNLLAEKKELEDKLNYRQKKIGIQFQDHSHMGKDEKRRVQKLIQTQALEIKALRQEISVLSLKGGHILPPAQPSLLPVPSAIPHVNQHSAHHFPGHGGHRSAPSRSQT
ncbi:cilia- and flagella-associated protein 44 [Arapaima gigas]